MSDNQIIEPVDFTRAAPDTGRRLFAPSPLKVFVAILFLVLAFAALFMFNARAVRFEFTPPVDNLEISGSIPTYLLGERFLMQQGDYEITATADGYEEFQTIVTVGSEPDQDFEFALTKLPGILTVTASYADQPITAAEVLIDQEARGSTPVVIDPVAAGTRDVYVNHPRYLPYQTSIEITGLRQQQETAVVLEPAWADVSVSSMPAGADILIDGERVGTTPATIEVLNGTRELQLKKPGYKIWNSALSIAPQESQEIADVALIKSDGKLNITSNPSGVNVTISGQYHGQTPLSLALAPSDSYQLTASKAGYSPLKRSFSIAPEEDQSLNLKLQPITGLIKLSVSPAGATLYVNDQERGNPNQTLELTARNHTLRVELPGFATYETNVIPQPGLSQQLNITLLTEEAAKVSSIPQRIKTSQGDTLRFILPGELTMGAGRREPGRRSNEVEKDVKLTKAFYLGEYEISNESFNAFDPGHDSGLLGRALLSESDRPVVNVSWEQAVRFCNWLSESDGLPVAYEAKDGKWQLIQPATTGYRLPTEAEWAWAARYADGTQPTRFPWGDAMPPNPGAGNFADESAISMVPYYIKSYNDNFRGPAPSGTYIANPLGIFDLAGNVSEWISDYYSIELERELLTDPTGPEDGDYYVIRGSNYTHGRFSELRWTFRDYGADARPDVGFRIARYLE